MPSPIATSVGGRILLYDADRRLAEGVCETLRDRGYLCTSASSTEDCIDKIESKEPKILFIGRCDDKLKLFDIVRHSQMRGIEVLILDRPDTEDPQKQIKWAAYAIETKVIFKSHKAG